MIQSRGEETKHPRGRKSISVGTPWGGPALTLFVFFLAFYYFTNAAWHKAGDESAMLHVAGQLATKAQVGFYAEKTPDDPHGDIVQGKNGLFYFKWGLGQSLVEVPLLVFHRWAWTVTHPGHLEEEASPTYEVTEFLSLLLVPSAISAFGCLLFFSLALRLGFSRATGIGVTFIYGLGTMIWPYSKSFASDTTLNVAILGSVYALISYPVTLKRGWLVLSGASMGFAVLTKPISLVVVPVLVIYFLAKVGPKQAARDLLLCWAPPFMAFLVLQGWYNVIRYGVILASGYDEGWGRLGFCTPLYVGMWGLFASPGKGFFLYAPAALLSFFGARRFFREKKPEAWLFCGICVLLTLPHATWCLWAGDWAWGPRFLLPLTPYLILPAGYLFEGWTERHRLHRMVLGGVVLASVGVQVLGVALHPFAFIETRMDVIRPLLNPEVPDLSYAHSYAENAFTNFSPMLSHIVGNCWLLKHMMFEYDLASDAPWRALGIFELGLSRYFEGNRTRPFFWIVGLPARSSHSMGFVYPLAVINFLLVVWSGLRMGRCFEESKKRDSPASVSGLET